MLEEKKQNLKTQSDGDKLENLLKITQENQQKIAKIYKWHRTRQIFFWIKWGFIALIIVSAWIYLPSFIDKIIQPYQESIKEYQQTVEGINEIRSQIPR